MMTGHAGKTQVRAFRFATRQIEWAITHGDPLPRSDPGQLPRRWTTVSLVLGLALCAGFAADGFIKPAPNWRDSPLILETESGTLYVNRSGVLHPALNLTSALLASDTSGGTSGRTAGSGVADRPKPEKVTAADLAGAPRGPLFGIPGAPNQLPDADNEVPDLWGVCDEAHLDVGRAAPADHVLITSTVTVGQVLPGVQLAGSEALLARTAGDAATGSAGELNYLIWNGHRSRIDLADPVIVAALQLAGQQPRTLSAGLLNAIPEQSPIAVPAVAGDGAVTTGFAIAAGDEPTGSLRAGDVFKVDRAGSVTFHLVHTDGVEQISATMADLLRFRRSLTADIPSVLPSVLAAAPAAASELVGTTALPPSVPTLVSGTTAPLVCAGWEGAAAPAPRWVVAVGVDIPSSAPLVALAGTSQQAGVRQVMVQPGHGAVVREYVAGQPADQQAKVYLVSDLGVAFPVAGADVLNRLGFSAMVRPAPKQVLDLLPRGPVLDLTAAAQLWDSFPPSMLSSASVDGGGG